MAKEIMGDACAFIPGKNGDKNRYFRIGTALRDGDRVSLKIDTIPLPQSGWDGWVNIFPKEAQGIAKPLAAGIAARPYDRARAGASGFDDLEDDIPF